MSDTCKSCGAPVVWGTTTANGRPIALDPNRTENGNVVGVGYAANGPLVHIFPPNALVAMRLHGRLALFQAHFATCPDAAKWRRKPNTKGDL